MKGNSVTQGGNYCKTAMKKTCFNYFHCTFQMFTTSAADQLQIQTTQFHTFPYLTFSLFYTCSIIKFEFCFSDCIFFSAHLYKIAHHPEDLSRSANQHYQGRFCRVNGCVSARLIELLNNFHFNKRTGRLLLCVTNFPTYGRGNGWSSVMMNGHNVKTL